MGITELGALMGHESIQTTLREQNAYSELLPAKRVQFYRFGMVTPGTPIGWTATLSSKLAECCDVDF